MKKFTATTASRDLAAIGDEIARQYAAGLGAQTEPRELVMIAITENGGIVEYTEDAIGATIVRLENQRKYSMANNLRRAMHDGARRTLVISRVRFTVGTLRVTCDDSPEAVAKLVARYKKGVKGAKWFKTGALPARDRSGYGKDYGAMAVVEHETIAA